MNGKAAITGLFDLPIPQLEDEVVKVEISPGYSPAELYAIRLKSGAYWGQKWNGMTRTYPIWKRKGMAQRKLDKLKKEGKI